MEVRLVLFLQALDAGAGGGEHDVRFGESALAALAGGIGIGRYDLTEERVGFGLRRSERNAGSEPVDDVEPLRVRVVDVGDVGEDGHRLDGQVGVRRGAGETVAARSLWGQRRRW